MISLDQIWTKSLRCPPTASQSLWEARWVTSRHWFYFKTIIISTVTMLSIKGMIISTTVIILSIEHNNYIPRARCHRNRDICQENHCEIEYHCDSEYKSLWKWIKWLWKWIKLIVTRWSCDVTHPMVSQGRGWDKWCYFMLLVADGLLSAAFICW